MEDVYGFHHTASYCEQSQSSMASPFPPSWMPIPAPDQSVGSGSSSSEAVSSEGACFEEDEVSKALRAKVASHPLYPKLRHAYIDCQKVGAPPEVAKLLEEIGGDSSNCCVCQIPALSGADPELDEFMEMYCNLMVKFKSDLSGPFDEAIAFFNDMETQLKSICIGSTVKNNISDEANGLPEEDFSREEKEAIDECQKINEDRELKDKLLRRYSGYITSLRHELSTKKKKQKLPKEASQILLAWWNTHFKWPYPTETDKVALAEWTGLDQKQINNWFINQRKRHWKPPVEMQASAWGSFYDPPRE